MSSVETHTAFCIHCGHETSDTASFCARCGGAQPVVARQAGAVPGPSVAPPAVGGARPHAAADTRPATGDLSDEMRQRAAKVGGGIRHVSPGSDELASALVAQVSAPGAIAGLITVAATVIVAATLAVVLAVLPVGDSSLIVFDHSAFKFMPEVLFQFGRLFGGMLNVGADSPPYSVQTMPLLLVAVPLTTVVLMTRWQSRRLAAVPPVARLLWGSVAAAIPLALVLLLVAVLSKHRMEGTTLQLAVGPTALLGLLWGGLGGLLGAFLGLRRDGLADRLLPPLGNQLAGVLAAATRSLAGALLVAALGVTALVAVQSVRGVHDVAQGRSKVGTTAENSLYVVEHGVHGVVLGTFAKFSYQRQGALEMPIPITKYRRVASRSGFRVTDYGRALPSWLFILGLIALVAVPAFMALNAGFTCARVAGATSVGQHLAWGLVPAPIWALALVALNLLANKTTEFPLFGLGNGGSVFGMTLLFAGVLGALGGLLASQSTRKPDGRSA